MRHLYLRFYPAADKLAALTDLSSRTGIEFTLRDTDSALIAATADSLPVSAKKRTGLTRLSKREPVVALALSNGRWLVARDSTITTRPMV